MEVSIATRTFTLLATLISIVSGYSGKVLVVSFDGFRWDYLNNIDGLVNFQRLEREGVRAPYMNATFSTVTFPNHYSIATGLYEESHGILLNRMYDPVSKTWFNRGPTSSNSALKWWDGGEPFWITAEKQGIKAGVSFWVSGNDEIRGTRVSYSRPYNTSMSWEQQVDEVMDWYVRGGIHVGALYNVATDEAGHCHGPYSKETNDSVLETDAKLGYLLDKMEENDLVNRVNLLVVSDHGMAKVSFDKVIDLHDYIEEEDYEVLVGADSLCMVLPRPGMREVVYGKLKDKHPSMGVWYKEDLPERWHYKNNDRVLPIVIVMEIGWQCVEDKSDPWYKTAGGAHGYDNALPEMRAIFLARGPDFKMGYKMEPLICVDIYGLVCHLIGVKPSPNNGTMAHVEGMIMQEAEVYALINAAHRVGFNINTYRWIFLAMLSGFLWLME